MFPCFSLGLGGLKATLNILNIYLKTKRTKGNTFLAPSCVLSLVNRPKMRPKIFKNIFKCKENIFH